MRESRGTKGVTLLLGRSDSSPIPAPHFPFKTITDNGEHSFTGTSAVLVFGNGFADAVTAGPLAAAANGPLLLTASRDLEPQVLALLKEKGIKRVFVVGGSKSVPEAKATALRTTRIEVVRVAGSNRYENAVAVAREVAKLSASRQVFVADGQRYPDALAAGPAAARSSGVVVLSAGKQLPSVTAAFLSSHPAAPKVAVGGNAATALRQSPHKATEIKGKNREETATLLAATFIPNATAAVLVSGVTYVDALPGGALAASRDAPLLLSKKQGLSGVTYSYLAQNVKVRRVEVIGGFGSLSGPIGRTLRGILSQR